MLTSIVSLYGFHTRVWADRLLLPSHDGTDTSDTMSTSIFPPLDCFIGCLITGKSNAISKLTAVAPLLECFGSGEQRCGVQWAPVLSACYHSRMYMRPSLVREHLCRLWCVWDDSLLFQRMTSGTAPQFWPTLLKNLSWLAMLIMETLKFLVWKDFVP